MSNIIWPQKHPAGNEPFFLLLCSKNGTNDGGEGDTGELQGRTISSVAWTVPAGITKVSDNTAAVTIKNVSYGINTVATIVLSGGTDGESYEFTCAATLSDGFIVPKNIILPVKAQG